MRPGVVVVPKPRDQLAPGVTSVFRTPDAQAFSPLLLCFLSTTEDSAGAATLEFALKLEDCCCCVHGQLAAPQLQPEVVETE